MRRIAAAGALALAGASGAQAEGAPDPWRVDLSVARSELSNGQAAWTDALAGLTYRPDGATWLTAGMEHSERFGRGDGVAFGRMARATPGGAIFQLGLAVAPGAEFRARRQAQAGGLTRPFAIGGGWTAALGVDGSVARYRSGDVTSIQPHLVLSTRRGDSLSVRLIETWDEFDRRRQGYAVRAEVQVADPARLLVSYADAPESDLGLTVETQAYAVAATFEIGDRLSVRAGALHEKRPTFDRNELSLSFARRF